MNSTLPAKPKIMGYFGRLIYIGFYIVLSVWIVSCQNNEPPNDYLTGIPCAVPCWQGITPGTTSEATALKIIQDRRLVKQDSISAGINSVDPSRNAYRYHRTDGGSGRISINDGIVYKIEIRPSPKQLTLGETIDAFGMPEFIYVKTSVLDSVCVEISIFYPREGLIIDTGDCGENNVVYEIIEVSEDLEVVNISLFEPNPDIESFLIESQLLEPELAYNIVKNAEPWAGFNGYARMPPLR